MQFKLGDIVQLKSGGPKMTVNGFTGTKQPMCAWFDGSNVLCHGTFMHEALKAAS